MTLRISLLLMLVSVLECARPDRARTNRSADSRANTRRTTTKKDSDTNVHLSPWLLMCGRFTATFEFSDIRVRLLKQLPAELLDAHDVSPIVNSAKYDGPECIRSVSDDEMPTGGQLSLL